MRFLFVPVQDPHIGAVIVAVEEPSVPAFADAQGEKSALDLLGHRVFEPSVFRELCDGVLVLAVLGGVQFAPKGEAFVRLDDFLACHGIG